MGYFSKEMCRAFRITCQGVYVSGKVSSKRVSHRETNSPQFTRDKVLKRLKSLVYDPKPRDLVVGKVKPS